MAGVWQKAHAPDGREYYYNTVTKATQWTRPEEDLSPAEVGDIRNFRCDELLTVGSARKLTLPGRRPYTRMVESIGTTMLPGFRHGRCQSL